MEGFFKQQAAAGAASALRSGNEALLGLFGQTAIGAGFQDLAQQEGVDDATKRRAADMTLNQFGITDRGAADVLAEQTQEVRVLNSQAQEFAKIMGKASDALTQMEQKELLITAQQVNIIERKAGRAANLRTGTTNLTNNKNLHRGGPVYADRGMFIPRGTDTVPAMLTPGEFVVNRASVQRGNNLAVLQAMNNNQQAAGPAMNRGGSVRYYGNGSDGGVQPGGGGVGISAETVTSLNNVFSTFSTAVDKLVDMKLTVKLDPTEVNVNFNNTSFLATLHSVVASEVLAQVRNQIPNIGLNLAGDPTFNQAVG